MGIDFAGTIYYDWQGFLIPKALGISSAKELDGATICIHSGTTTELNLDDYFKSHKMRYKALAFEVNSDLILLLRVESVMLLPLMLLDYIVKE